MEGKSENKTKKMYATVRTEIHALHNGEQQNIEVFVCLHHCYKCNCTKNLRMQTFGGVEGKCPNNALL